MKCQSARKNVSRTIQNFDFWKDFEWFWLKIHNFKQILIDPLSFAGLSASSRSATLRIRPCRWSRRIASPRINCHHRSSLAPGQRSGEEHELLHHQLLFLYNDADIHTHTHIYIYVYTYMLTLFIYSISIHHFLLYCKRLYYIVL